VNTALSDVNVALLKLFWFGATQGKLHIVTVHYYVKFDKSSKKVIANLESKYYIKLGDFKSMINVLFSFDVGMLLTS
jgi:hypothetical protein